MKRLFLILAAVVAVVSCHRETIGGIEETGGKPVDKESFDDADDVNWDKAIAYVFDPEVIPEIHVSVSQYEWDRLMKLYEANHNTQEFIHCDVKYIKGKDVTNVKDAGLRLKGNTSRRRPEKYGFYHHCHFGLNLHHYAEDGDHTIQGVRRFDLKWFKDDPAYVREIFCYDLFRREGVWTAVNDTYCRLWLKIGDKEEAYFGVYGQLEHIDKNYLRAREKQFGGHGGNLWKCRFGSNLRKGSGSMGADDNQHDYTYELKTNKTQLDAAKQQLNDFINNLNNLSGNAFNEWLSSVMDVELFLKTYAVNVAVGMWDDYWNNGNNFYLYFNSTDTKNYKVWFIPYDYDNTLGTTINCGVQTDAGRQNPLKWGQDDRPLVKKILANGIWRDYYLNCLRELCAGNFSADASATRITAWQNSIARFVDNDTNEDTVIEDKPASWSTHTEYRLLAPGSNNFFEVKAASIPK